MRDFAIGASCDDVRGDLDLTWAEELMKSRRVGPGAYRAENRARWLGSRELRNGPEGLLDQCACRLGRTVAPQQPRLASVAEAAAAPERSPRTGQPARVASARSASPVGSSDRRRAASRHPQAESDRGDGIGFEPELPSQHSDAQARVRTRPLQPPDQLDPRSIRRSVARGRAATREIPQTLQFRDEARFLPMEQMVRSLRQVHIPRLSSRREHRLTL